MASKNSMAYGTDYISSRKLLKTMCTYLRYGKQLEEFLCEELVVPIVACNVVDELLHIF